MNMQSGKNGTIDGKSAMTTAPLQFKGLSRLLHWTMAVLVLSQLAIGLTMVVSLESYHRLVAIHRPLGIAILILVVVRFANRLLNSAPPFPASMSPTECRIARASELTMYGFMFLLPLVGWGMLSAARYPIVLWGPAQLPFILPHDLVLYAMLRRAHTILAYLFLVAIFAHVTAILFHTIVLRDGIILRMAPWNTRPTDGT